MSAPLHRLETGRYYHDGTRGRYYAERMYWADPSEWQLTYPDGDGTVAVSLAECRRWILDNEVAA